MRTRKPWRLGIILLAAPLLLAITGEGGYPQAPPITPSTPPIVPQPAPPYPIVSASSVLTAPVLTASATVQQPPTVEQLLDQITTIRTQKAELEKREQALVSTLRMKLAAQKERLTKLGIAENAAAPRTQVDDVPPPVIPSK